MLYCHWYHPELDPETISYEQLILPKQCQGIVLKLTLLLPLQVTAAKGRELAYSAEILLANSVQRPGRLLQELQDLPKDHTLWS